MVVFAERSIPWVLGTDVNAVIDESEPLQLVTSFGGYAKRVFRPIRWEGNREVDFLVTNRPAHISQPHTLGARISDHVPLFTSLPSIEEDVKQGTLKPTPTLSSLIRLMLSIGGSCSNRRGTSKKAFLPLRHSCSNTPWNLTRSGPATKVSFTVLFCKPWPRLVRLLLLSTSCPKGGGAQHQWQYWSRRGPQLDVGSFQLRSTRKKLARACELSRLLRAGREDNFDVIQGLTAKLQLAEPSLRTVTALIR